MTHACLNPACGNDLPVAGVCVTCANSTYKPSRDGLDLGTFTVEGSEA